MVISFCQKKRKPAPSRASARKSIFTRRTASWAAKSLSITSHPASASTTPGIESGLNPAGVRPPIVQFFGSHSSIGKPTGFRVSTETHSGSACAIDPKRKRKERPVAAVRPVPLPIGRPKYRNIRLAVSSAAGRMQIRLYTKLP